MAVNSAPPVTAGVIPTAGVTNNGSIPVLVPPPQTDAPVVDQDGGAPLPSRAATTLVAPGPVQRQALPPPVTRNAAGAPQPGPGPGPGPGQVTAPPVTAAPGVAPQPDPAAPQQQPPAPQQSDMFAAMGGLIKWGGFGATMLTGGLATFAGISWMPIVGSVIAGCVAVWHLAQFASSCMAGKPNWIHLGKAGLDLIGAACFGLPLIAPAMLGMDAATPDDMDFYLGRQQQPAPPQQPPPQRTAATAPVPQPMPS